MQDTFFVVWFVAAFVGMTALAFLCDAKTKGEALTLSTIAGVCLSAVVFLPI